MPLIQGSAVALPHIDRDVVSDAQLAAARRLIEAEIDESASTTPHPAIPTRREIEFSEAITAEHARIAAGEPKTSGLDLSRYELLDPPADGDLAGWQIALKQAYASAQYLRAREINLGLLEAYGKNAWLIGNARIEDELRTLEKEVDAKRVALEQVEQARRDYEASIAGEMEGLQQTWRAGIGRLIEAQAAGETLRQEILERKRHAAMK